MDKYDPDKRVAMVVDEWGNWFSPKKGTNPGFLEQDNSVCDAVVAGITLNIFNNHSDRVRIANLAQAVNVLQSPVLTQGDKIVLTPTWHVLHQYKGHQGATLLGTSAAYSYCGVNDVPDYNASLRGLKAKEDVVVPGLSVSASEKDAPEKSGAKKQYLVTIANADADTSKEVEISFAHLDASIKSATATVVTGDKMDTINTFGQEDAVTEKTLQVKINDGNTVSINLGAHAVAAVTVLV